MSSGERVLFEKIQPALQAAQVSSTRIQVFAKGELRVDLGWGDSYTYYDLASLTKIIFSTTRLMQLVAEKKIDLKSHVNTYLGWLTTQGFKPRIRDLLSHSAGMTWWKPYYEQIDLTRSRSERWNQLRELLKQNPPPLKPPRSIYSDLDFFLLGFVMEKVGKTDLFKQWTTCRSDLKGRLHFNIDNKPRYKRELYAPTEKSKWLGRILQGEVHDENTYALGGVAPHAGLFGRIEDVSEWAVSLRQAFYTQFNRRRGPFVPDVLRTFSRRSVPVERGDWGLGFMKPTLGRASCGQFFSSRSFGHTGFTGTSFWMDPKHDLMIILLSNRVHPTRDNQGFVTLRPKIHDWVFETAKEQKWI